MLINIMLIKKNMYRESEATQIPGNSNLCEAFRGNFKREVGSSLYYHTISMRTCSCVCICLIFWFAYLTYYCFCAMLLIEHNVPYNKGVSAITFYIKQALPQ